MATSNSGSRDHSFKIVLLGEGAVGKTSLVLRYVENKFNDKHITTLQVRLGSVLMVQIIKSIGIVTVNKSSLLVIQYGHGEGSFVFY